ncbi:MAG TPA: hypothetical protein VHA53_09675, partial [Nitrolancea sp.]|nr:hypothetical protein [Nitrolancea sp.]
EPPTTASKLSDWFVAHRGVFLTQEYLRVLATFAMMIFIGGVVATIRRVTGRIGPLEMVVVAAGAIFSLMMLISNVAACGAAVVAGKAGVDGGTILALHLFGETMRHVNAIGCAFMIGTATLALHRARVIPTWVGVLGAVSVPVLLVGGVGFPNTRVEFLDYVAFPLMPLWPLVTSLSLLIGSRARGRVVTGVRHAIA